MARTNRSMVQEDVYTSQIPQNERALRRLRRSAGGALATSAVATVDALTNGRLTDAYNTYLLDHLPAVEAQIPLGNVTVSRLAVAGLYTGVGIISAIGANRRQGRVDHLESMAAQEQHMDRLTNATQLAAGQRLKTDVMAEPGDII